MHKTKKNEPKKAKKWAVARGECDLTLQGSPFGRNIKRRPDEVPRRNRKSTLVETRRMNVRTNKPYRPYNQNNRSDIQEHRPDVLKHRPDASHKRI
jgi:hypothetical protein